MRPSFLFWLLVLWAGGSALAEPPGPAGLKGGFEALPMPEPCRISRQEMGLGPSDNVWVDMVTERVSVAIVTCERHAYQETGVAIRLERVGEEILAILLGVPTLRTHDGSLGADLAYQPWLTGWIGAVEDGRIGLHYKGRGIGDCGEAVVYDVTAPVVRVVEYLAKSACDGQGADPGAWPPVPRRMLTDHAPLILDRDFAELLSGLLVRWPNTDWMAHAPVRVDLDGDGAVETWVGGFERDWERDRTSYHLIREQAGALRGWTLPIDGDRASGLCRPAARLDLSTTGDRILVDDGLCDPIRIGWSQTSDDLFLERN